MQEVIDELLKAEAEAQQAIAQARDDAQKRKNLLETDYSLKVNEAREQARRLVLERVEKAREEMNAATIKTLEKARADIESRFSEQQQAIEGIADEVIRLIMTPEYERDEE
jgi:vacuolar-type H+-ATPase subunit H